MKDIRDTYGQNYRDEEDIHYDMDNLMCEVLTELGYGDGVKVFRNEPKWYS